MITLYDPNGHSAQVVAQAVPFWLSRGWTEGKPQEAVSAPPVNLVVSEELRQWDARTQATDVTAPGESEVEGVAAPSKQEKE